MNLNREVMVADKKINQLSYLSAMGKLVLDKKPAEILSLPDDENTNIALEQRARAYMEINCAHCHFPEGMAYRQSLNLGYTISLQESGIELQRTNIADRMSSPGRYHMPKTGTTMMDKEGIRLIRMYMWRLRQ